MRMPVALSHFGTSRSHELVCAGKADAPSFPTRPRNAAASFIVVGGEAAAIFLSFSVRRFAK